MSRAVLLVAGAGALGLASLAAWAIAVDGRRPIGDRVKVGDLIRANVRSEYFQGDEVCMRVSRVEWSNGRASSIWARIEDRRHPGAHSADLLVAPADVLVIAPAGSKACPAPLSTRWVEVPEDESVMLRRGLRYRGGLVLPALIPRAFVRGKLGPGLAAYGFDEVSIAEGVGEYDFMVEGVWSKPDELVEWPGALETLWREG